MEPHWRSTIASAVFRFRRCTICDAVRDQARPLSIPNQ